MDILKPGDIAFDPSINLTADPPAPETTSADQPVSAHSRVLEELLYLGQNATPLPDRYFFSQEQAKDTAYAHMAESLDIQKTQEVLTWFAVLFKLSFPHSRDINARSTVAVQLNPISKELFQPIVTGLYGAPFTLLNAARLEDLFENVVGQFPETIPLMALRGKFIPLSNSPVHPILAVPLQHRPLLAGALKYKGFSKNLCDVKLKTLSTPYLSTKDVCDYAVKTGRAEQAPEALRAYCEVFTGGVK